MEPKTKERAKFLKEQDGWTEFNLETVKVFGKKVDMVECTKCGVITTLHETKIKLLPLHCVACGRVILKQDYAKYNIKTNIPVD